MLKRLIFAVSKETELPVYDKEKILVCRMEEQSASDDTEVRESIYVCDDSSVARKLHTQGKYVVALLTNSNSEQDFSFCPYAIMDAKECEAAFFEGIMKRFKGEPWNILETERCLVRETSVEDVDAFYKLYEHEEITKYMEPLFEDRDEEIEYTKSYIKNVYEFYGFGMWTVVEKNTGKVIGRAGVSYREGFSLPELGFMIGKNYQRQGYAYEVCSAIADYMYENHEMEEILIFIEPKNTPSIFLAKKLGAFFYKEQCMGKCDAYIMKLPR